MGNEEILILNAFYGIGFYGPGWGFWGGGGGTRGCGGGEGLISTVACLTAVAGV